LYDPEKTALCSETPDEEALIYLWILLSIWQKEKRKISACRVNVGWGTDWVVKTVMVNHGSLNVTPNKVFPTVTQPSALQRNIRVY